MQLASQPANITKKAAADVGRCLFNLGTYFTADNALQSRRALAQSPLLRLLLRFAFARLVFAIAARVGTTAAYRITVIMRKGSRAATLKRPIITSYAKSAFHWLAFLAAYIFTGII